MRKNSRNGIGHSQILLAAVLAVPILPTHALAGANDFTLVMIPDTQYEVQNETPPLSFGIQTQWIVDQKAQWLANPSTGTNVAFVTHVGDVVNNGWNQTQWNTAVSAMNTLKNSSIPFGLAVGNHDVWETKPPVTYSAQGFVTNFGPQYFTGKSFYGGASPSGFSSFQTFTAGGRQYVNLSLDINATQTEMDWAQGVINSHPSISTILTTHDYLSDNGARGTGLQVPLTGRNTGEQIWQKFVKKNNEIFMVLNGHYFGQAQQLSFNDAGHEVFEILADYQSLQKNGQDNGLGFLRLMNFDPDAGRMSVRTYSPVLGRDLQSGDGMTGGLGNFGFSIDLNSRFNSSPLVNVYNWKAGNAGNWSDATKWNENATPSAGLTSLNFAGTSDYTATNDLPGGVFPTMVQELNFTNTAGTVTIGGSGGTLNLRGGNGTLGTAQINVAAGAKARIDSVVAASKSPVVATIDGELTITNNVQNFKSFTKEGAGALILSDTTGRFVGNTTVTINGGSIRMGSNDAIYSQTSVNLGPNGTLDDSYGNGEGFAMLTGTGTYLGRAGANFNLGENNATGTFAGRITAGTNGVVGATAAQRNLLLKKTNTGTLTLTGSNSDFAGQTQVLLGTLEVNSFANRGSSSSLGLGDVNNLGDGAGANLGVDIAIGDAATSTTLSTDAKLRYSGASTATDRTIAVVGKGGTIDISNSSTDLRLNGAIRGAGELVKSGAGKLTLAATPTNAGAITINQGTLAMDPGSGLIQLSQAVKGTGQFVKAGSGTLELTTTASFASTVDLQVSQGTLRTAKNAALGDANSINIASGATWDDSYGNGERVGGLNGSGTFIAHVESNTGMTLGGSAVNSTFDGKITAGLNGVIGMTNSARTINWFNKIGTGTLTLTNAASDFQSRVHVQQGTLSISNLANRGQASAAGVGSSGSSADIAIGTNTQTATLRYTGSSITTDRRLEVQHVTGSAIDVTQPSTVFTVGIVQGAYSNASLTKSGAGTLVLGSNATYTGDTFINQGTLQFNGTTTTKSIYAAQGTSVILNNSAISRQIPITLEENARLTSTVAANGDYTDIGSCSAAGGTLLGSTSRILAGRNSSAGPANLALSWRGRTAGEQAAGNSHLFSDVASLTDVSGVYVMSETYSDASLGGVNENSLVLGWLSASGWVNAIEGNTGGSASQTIGAFADTGLAGLADDLGRYGVDPATNTVWAVVNHNSEFSVVQAVPEPASVSLLTVTAGLLLARRRK